MCNKNSRKQFVQELLQSKALIFKIIRFLFIIKLKIVVEKLLESIGCILLPTITKINCCFLNIRQRLIKFQSFILPLICCIYRKTEKKCNKNKNNSIIIYLFFFVNFINIDRKLLQVMENLHLHSITFGTNDGSMVFGQFLSKCWRDMIELTPNYFNGLAFLYGKVKMNRGTSVFSHFQITPMDQHSEIVQRVSAQGLTTPFKYFSNNILH